MGKTDFSIYGDHHRQVNWIILLCLFLLGLVGLFILLTTNLVLFWQQLGFLIVGMLLMLVFSRVDPAVLWWIAPYGYILSLVLLAVSYVFDPIRGASRWIVIGGMQLQPSEVMKPFLILAFSRSIASFSPRRLMHSWIHGIVFAIPFVMVFRQPDLGSSIVYAVAWVSMMIAGGFPISILVLGSMISVAGFPVFWNTLAEYQKARLLTFIQPNTDPYGAGYNALQAMIAVGSGQIFGRGLGMGTQSHLRFLPEYHTDFIFATLVEELGFVGGLMLLLLYGTLLWQLISPYLRGAIGNTFVFFYTVGLFGILMAQVCINTGMNMGIIPVTGITLPFVSYGGSSILSLCIAFGMLISLRKHRARTDIIAFTGSGAL